MKFFRNPSRVQTEVLSPRDGRMDVVRRAMPADVKWTIGRHGLASEDVAMVVALEAGKPVGLAALRAESRDATELELRRVGVWSQSDRHEDIGVELLVAAAAWTAERDCHRLTVVEATEQGVALIRRAMSEQRTAVPIHGPDAAPRAAEPTAPRSAGPDEVEVRLAQGDELRRVLTTVPQDYRWPIAGRTHGGTDDAVAVAWVGDGPVGLAALRVVDGQFVVRCLGVWTTVPTGTWDVVTRLLDVIADTAQGRGARELILPPNTRDGERLVTGLASTPTRLPVRAPRGRA